MDYRELLMCMGRKWIISWNNLPNTCPQYIDMHTCNCRLMSTEAQSHHEWSYIHLSGGQMQPTCKGLGTRLELYAIVMACEMWSKHWAGKRILFYCDNEAVTGVWQSGLSYLLRGEELTCPSATQFNPAHHLSTQDVIVSDKALTFTIKALKTYQLGKSVTRTIPATKTSTCPVKTMQQYLQL